jgi:hypothetical protein
MLFLKTVKIFDKINHAPPAVVGGLFSSCKFTKQPLIKISFALPGFRNIPAPNKAKEFIGLL